MSLYIYLAIITAFFFAFVAIIFNVLDYASDISEEHFEDLINDSSDKFATYSLSTRSTIRNVWKYWPTAMFLVVLVWAIVAVQKKDEMYG